PALAAGAAARRARLLDDRAHAVTARARLLQREQSLRGRHHAGAVALRARRRCRTWGCARPMARVTRKLELHRHRDLCTTESILERHAYLDLDIVSALAPLLR